MRLIEITGNEPETAVYLRLTEAQLRNRLSPEDGVFIAESPKVIATALGAGMQPLSILCERKHIAGDAKGIIDSLPDDFPVYTADREVLEKMTGYTLTRGVLCAMRRPADCNIDDVVTGARRVVVIDGVTDTTNIGAIFRSAAALGIDGVLLTRTSCDPLNRRAVRVSMGSVFLVPWGWIDKVEEVKNVGFKTVAMALRDNSVQIDDERLRSEEKLAIVMGTEGDGLSDNVIADADYVVKIPMAHGVDSLNVAAASAVAFWELTKR